MSATSASPIGLVPPIVDCPVEAVCAFSVPASDPDNQPMRWRLATGVEAGGFVGGFTQPAGAAIDAATGVYTWDTHGALLASSGSTFYSTQVMIENVVGGNVDQSHGSRLLHPARLELDECTTRLHEPDAGERRHPQRTW